MSTPTARAPEISCKQLVELVTEYLEGTMPAGERARFEGHLEACDGCSTYVEQMRETISALGHIPPESLSAGAERSLLDAFRGWRSDQARP